MILICLQRLFLVEVHFCLYCEGLNYTGLPVLAGMYLDGHFFQDGGSMNFSSCQADIGGGLSVIRYFHQQAGRMHFLDCHAAVGGGIWVQENMTVGSSVVLSKCNAHSSDVGGSRAVNRTSSKQEIA